MGAAYENSMPTCEDDMRAWVARTATMEEGDMARTARAARKSGLAAAKLFAIRTLAALSLVVAALWGLPALADQSAAGLSDAAALPEKLAPLGCGDVPGPWVPSTIRVPPENDEPSRRQPLENPVGDVDCTIA